MRKILLALLLALPLTAFGCGDTNSTSSEITIEMSQEAREMTEQRGTDMGNAYFQKDCFESEMRPSYYTREANSELPTVDGDGQPLQYSTSVTDTLYGSNHVYTFTPDNYTRVIMYVHGGAYVNAAAWIHAVTGDKLAEKLNAKIYMPMYTLAPQGTWAEGYDLMNQVWTDVVAEGKDAYLMGDSAGGGLALGFAEELAETDGVLPEKMVLFSPWMDVTMSNPAIADYEDLDLSLAPYGLIECGKMWAGSLDPNDRKISPIHYENWNKLPDTLLFIGTNEIFYPDVEQLYENLRSAGNNTVLVKGNGLFHVFPVYVTIPESTQSREIIKEFIEK